MRMIATSPWPDCKFRWAMIYDPEDGTGVFLFLYESPDDSLCVADYWYERVSYAERHAADDLGINPDDWVSIPDPSPGFDNVLPPGTTP